MDKLNEWIEAERGRRTALAKAIGITPAAIWQWQKVPAERIGDISRFTGIPLEELRPDIFGAAERVEAAE